MSGTDGISTASTPRPAVSGTGAYAADHGLAGIGSTSSLASALSTNASTNNFLLGSCRKTNPKRVKGRSGVKRANTLKLLPSRLASRIYGQVNSLPIPYHLRTVAYSSWGWAFKAKMDEVPLPLTAYPSLVSFFTRKLKPGVRPVDDRASIVSPADSAVVSTSSDLMGTGILRQVKGFDFKVEDFLGLPAPPKVTNPEKNVLHSIVLYLSPGDYHRFHSPTEWTVESRTHIAGQLLPVNPIVAHLLPSLLCTNERVALMGKWHHGFFSYTAVGATNVGSIRLTHEPELKTNLWRDDWRTGFSVNDALGLKPATLRVPQAVDPRIGLKKLAQLSATSSQAVAAHLPKAIPMAMTSLGRTIYSSLQAFNPLAFLGPQRKLEKQISAAAAATAAAKGEASASAGAAGSANEEVGRAAAEAALLNPARARARSRAGSSSSMATAMSMNMSMSVGPSKQQQVSFAAAADDDDGDISPPLKVRAPKATAGLTGGLLGGLLGGGNKKNRADSFLDDDVNSGASGATGNGGGGCDPKCPPPPFIKAKAGVNSKSSRRVLKKATTAQAFAAATAPSAGAVSRVSGETVVANSSAPSGAYLPSAPILKARHYDTPLQLRAGDEVGWFELGSTVVLIFEAPRDFKFSEGVADSPGAKVVLGRPLTPVERAWDGPRGVVQGLTQEQAHDFLNAEAATAAAAGAASTSTTSNDGGATEGAGAMPEQPAASATAAADTSSTSSSIFDAAVKGLPSTSAWLLKAAGFGSGVNPAEGSSEEEGETEGEEGDEEEDQDEDGQAYDEEEEGEGEGDEEEGADTVTDEEAELGADEDAARGPVTSEGSGDEGAAYDDGNDDFLSAVSFDDEDAAAMETVIENEKWGRH